MSKSRIPMPHPAKITFGLLLIGTAAFLLGYSTSLQAQKRRVASLEPRNGINEHPFTSTTDEHSSQEPIQIKSPKSPPSSKDPKEEETFQDKNVSLEKKIDFLSTRQAYLAARNAFVTGDYQTAARYYQDYKQLKSQAKEEKKIDLQPKIDSTAATLLEAQIAYKQKHYTEALSLLNQLPEEHDPMVDWLKGDIYTSNNEPLKAIEAYNRVKEKEKTSYQFRAQTKLAQLLFQTKQYDKAKNALSQIIRNFPDHPAHPRLLLQYAHTLHALNQKQAAADAYQDAWFEYPYKQSGKIANTKLKQLKKEGILPTKQYTLEERYKRLRRLRINKHWDDAEKLLEELIRDSEAVDPLSELTRDARFQYALNAYHSRHFKLAAQRLNSLIQSYYNGETLGPSLTTLYRYLSFSYDGLGNIEEARKAWNKATVRAPKQERIEDLIEFETTHGNWQAALDIANKYWSARKKESWHYAFLLFLAKEYKESVDLLLKLSKTSSGQQQEKYIYWAARAYQEMTNTKAARLLYNQLAAGPSYEYYRILARSRLADLALRDSVNPTLNQLIGESVENAFHDKAFQTQRTSISSTQKPPQRDQQWRPKSHTSSLASKSEKSTENNKIDTITTTNDVPRVVPEGDRIDSTPIDSGRIHWRGKLGSQLDFEAANNGVWPGPIPTTPTAYVDDATGSDREGVGLDAAVKAYGNEFPELARARWLWQAGFQGVANEVARNVIVEVDALREASIKENKPIELPHKRWAHQIDHRRTRPSGFWGVESEEKRFPIPQKRNEQNIALQRQLKIIRKNKDIRTTLIPAYQDLNDYHMVRKIRRSLGSWEGSGPTGNTRDLWSEVYPRAFPAKILAKSRKRGVNPYLLWALMTVESTYNPDSISYAGALGLLQVIPRTGLKVAELLEDEDFGAHELLEPEVAIEHGTFYFSQLLKKFHGQELLAFAGYNGGPHRVGDWLDSRGKKMEMDTFIETIPYDQARNYAKKVLRFVALYLLIYEQKESIYVGTGLDANYLPKPKF